MTEQQLAVVNAVKICKDNGDTHGMIIFGNDKHNEDRGGVPNVSAFQEDFESLADDKDVVRRVRSTCVPNGASGASFADATDLPEDDFGEIDLAAATITQSKPSKSFPTNMSKVSIVSQLKERGDIGCCPPPESGVIPEELFFQPPPSDELDKTCTTLSPTRLKLKMRRL